MPITRREALLMLGTAAVEHAAITGGLCPKAEPLTGAEPYCFEDSQKVRHQIYVFGASGPPVLLLHELPGLVTDDVEVARRLAAANYRVIMPLFFGKAGRDAGWWTTTLNAHRVCGADEFACGKSRQSSPHILWLRELVADIRTKFTDGRGVSVIGMCLTGAFPLALLGPSVVAAVACQPTLPFNLFSRFGWFTDESGLGLSDEDLTVAKSSSAPILGIRYTRDWRCREERFERLTKELSERFFRLDLDGKGHSTLASSCSPEAFAEVLAFLNRYGRVEPDPSTPAFPVKSRANSLTPVLVKPRGPCPAHHDGRVE